MNTNFKSRNNEKASVSHLGNNVMIRNNYFTVYNSSHNTNLKNSTKFKRIFWIICFAFAGICAVYFTRNIYQKCNRNSMIVSINSLPTPVEDIPFPAVTICNSNSVKRSVAEDILMRGTATEKRMLEEICGVNSSASSHSIDDENWIDRFNLMFKAHHPCQEMLKVCTWNLHEYDCSRLFTTVLTDEGYCCTFNQLPLNYIFRYPLKHQEYTGGGSLVRDSYQIDDWNPERGYSPNAPYNVFPFRSPGRGRSLGLMVILDADVANYYCTTTNDSIGFKVLLHNPAEIQTVSQNFFFLSPGFESNVDFTPDIRDTSDELKAVDVENRRCYFNDETDLQYYRSYTRANCKMDCIARAMLEICGCVFDYLPRNESARVCGKRRDHCNINLKEEIKFLNVSTNLKKSCSCYNGCATLGFTKHMSYGKLTGSFRLKESFLNNITKKYLRENIAIAHIYLLDDHFMTFTTSMLCDFSNIISSLGGILALFLGFSVLSIVEIFYYLTLNVLCRSLRLKRKGAQEM